MDTFPGPALRVIFHARRGLEPAKHRASPPMLEDGAHRTRSVHRAASCHLPGFGGRAFCLVGGNSETMVCSCG